MSLTHQTATEMKVAKNNFIRQTISTSPQKGQDGVLYPPHLAHNIK